MRGGETAASAPHLRILCIDSLRMYRIGMFWETLPSSPLETTGSPQGGLSVSLVGGWMGIRLKTSDHCTKAVAP